MKTEQQLYTLESGWRTIKAQPGIGASLVLCFGSRKLLQTENWIKALNDRYPKASIVSVSTAGEINNESISGNTIVATALGFDKVQTSVAMVNIRDHAGSLEAGLALTNQIKKEGLQLCLVFSDGALVNGTDLIAGLNQGLKNVAPIAGGLAGDESDFKTTVVGLDDNLGEGNVVLIGLYGQALKVNFGSKGGWAEFGPTRTITRSNKNVLYEIDGEPCLDIYKKYLGHYAAELPASALLFPLALSESPGSQVVRTILNVDHEANSMTFAGNMPEGATVRLMKTTLENLSEAAGGAADEARLADSATGDKLALLISCVGRKLVFGSRIDEEFEAVRSSLGADTLISGFYSYGEISPEGLSQCQMHNQTMTITTLTEI